MPLRRLAGTPARALLMRSAVPGPAAGARWPAGRTPAIALVLALLAPAPGAAQAVAELVVTPSELVIEAGRPQTVVATAYDSSGNILSISIAFSSSNPAVAEVSPAGRVNGLAAGSALLTARAGAASAAVPVTVRTPAPPPPPAVPVASLALEPASLALLPLEPARLVAYATDAGGARLISPRLTWRSGDPRVASVDREGVVVAVAPGVTTITASADGGVSASVAVAVDTALFSAPAQVVLAPGGVDTLAVTVPSQGGRRLRAGVSWTSRDTAVVRVLPGGVARGVAQGATTILARGYGMSVEFRAIVRPPVASVQVTPAASGEPVPVPVATGRSFQVRALDAAGAPVPGVEPAWSVGDTTIGDFATGTGMFTARAVGRTTLTAMIAGLEPVVWTVEVIPVAVTLDRDRVGMATGDQLRLAARLVDPAGAVVPGLDPALTWSSSRPQVAGVANGAVTAQGLGRSTVTATTPWGSNGSAEVYVTGDLLVSSDRAARRGVGLYQLRLDDPGTLLPIVADTSTILHAELSPDRTRIAFSSNRAGSFDIWVVDADGANLRRVTAEPGNESEPSWTPDGAQLVFTSGAGGPSQVAMVPADSGAITLLTSGPGGNRQPAVSRDGRHVAFTSARDGNYELYVLTLEGGEIRRITATPGREQAPQWFANGDLLFASDQDDGVAIMRQRGGSRAIVAQLDDPLLELSLSRDGQRFAYLTGRIAERGSGAVEYRLVVQRVEAGGAPVAVPLRPGEQVATPSF